MKNNLLNKLFGLTVGALLATIPFNTFAETAEDTAPAPEQADQGCSGDEGCNADEACSGEEGCSGKEADTEVKKEEAPKAEEAAES